MSIGRYDEVVSPGRIGSQIQANRMSERHPPPKRVSLPARQPELIESKCIDVSDATPFDVEYLKETILDPSNIVEVENQFTYRKGTSSNLQKTHLKHQSSVTQLQYQSNSKQNDSSLSQNQHELSWKSPARPLESQLQVDENLRRQLWEVLTEELGLQIQKSNPASEMILALKEALRFRNQQNQASYQGQGISIAYEELLVIHNQLLSDRAILEQNIRQLSRVLESTDKDFLDSKQHYSRTILDLQNEIQRLTAEFTQQSCREVMNKCDQCEENSRVIEQMMVTSLDQIQITSQKKLKDETNRCRMLINDATEKHTKIIENLRAELSQRSKEVSKLAEEVKRLNILLEEKNNSHHLISKNRLIDEYKKDYSIQRGTVDSSMSNGTYRRTASSIPAHFFEKRNISALDERFNTQSGEKRVHSFLHIDEAVDRRLKTQEIRSPSAASQVNGSKRYSTEGSNTHASPLFLGSPREGLNHMDKNRASNMLALDRRMTQELQKTLGRINHSIFE